MIFHCICSFVLFVDFLLKRNYTIILKEKHRPPSKGRISKSLIMSTCTRAYSHVHTHNVGLHSDRAEDRLTTGFSPNESSPMTDFIFPHTFQQCSPPEGPVRMVSRGNTGVLRDFYGCGFWSTIQDRVPGEYVHAHTSD